MDITKSNFLTAYDKFQQAVKRYLLSFLSSPVNSVGVRLFAGVKPYAIQGVLVQTQIVLDRYLDHDQVNNNQLATADVITIVKLWSSLLLIIDTAPSIALKEIFNIFLLGSEQNQDTEHFEYGEEFFTLIAHISCQDGAVVTEDRKFEQCLLNLLARYVFNVSMQDLLERKRELSQMVNDLSDEHVDCIDYVNDFLSQFNVPTDDELSEQSNLLFQF